MAHYLNLNLYPSASIDDIKRSFKELSIKYHPDKNPQGREIFEQIHSSYKILSDHNLRVIYDYGYLDSYLLNKDIFLSYLNNYQILKLLNLFKDPIATNYSKFEFLQDINNKNVDKIAAIFIKSYCDSDQIFKNNYINIILGVILGYGMSWMYDKIKRIAPYAIFTLIGYYCIEYKYFDFRLINVMIKNKLYEYV